MFFAQFTRPAVGALAALVTSVGLSGAAHAASFASSEVYAEISVSVTSTGSVDVEGFDVGGSDFSDAFGSGAIDYEDSGVDTTFFISFVEAMVTAGPGLGGANSVLEALQDIVITNTSATTETIDIYYDMEVFASAEATSMDGEFADALAIAETSFVVLDSTGTELFFDGLEAVSDAVFGPFGPDSSSFSDFVSFVVPAGGSLFVYADAVIIDNFALVAPVPVPASLPLMAAGVGALALIRKRRA